MSDLWLKPPVERFGTLKCEEWGGGWWWWGAALSTFGRLHLGQAAWSPLRGGIGKNQQNHQKVRKSVVLPTSLRLSFLFNRQVYRRRSKLRVMVIQLHLRSKADWVSSSMLRLRAANSGESSGTTWSFISFDRSSLRDDALNRFNKIEFFRCTPALHNHFTSEYQCY